MSNNQNLFLTLEEFSKKSSDSIRGFVRPSILQSVGLSVCPLVRTLVTLLLESVKTSIIVAAVVIFFECGEDGVVCLCPPVHDVLFLLL